MLNQDTTFKKHDYLLYYIKVRHQKYFLHFVSYIVTHLPLLPLLHFISNEIFLKEKFYLLKKKSPLLCTFKLHCEEMSQPCHIYFFVSQNCEPFSLKYQK